MVIVILLILGLCLGSFVNALVWRIHEKKDWVRGRSVCVHCNHALAAKDLIPVISWLWLRGKCRYCHKPISWQYPAVETVTALLFVSSYAFWPMAFDGVGTTLFVFWLILLTGFVALAVYDIRWQLLPNKIVYFFMLVAAAQALTLVLVFDGGPEQMGQIALSFLVGGGLFYLLFQLSSGRWIGGGDVKLGALLGLVLAQPQLTLMMIFAASLLGTVVSLPLLAANKLKRDSHIPFGPFLIAGAIVARLFGAAIMTWYEQHLLG